MGAVLIGIALFVIPLFLLYYLVVGSIGVALSMAVIMIIAGFLFSSVSGYMAGLVGSSNNPVSGITICTILFASLVLMLMVGRQSPQSARLPWCSSVRWYATQRPSPATTCRILKAGQLIGATPWRQQVMLMVGVLASACGHGTGARMYCSLPMASANRRIAGAKALAGAAGQPGQVRGGRHVWRHVAGCS